MERQNLNGVELMKARGMGAQCIVCSRQKNQRMGDLVGDMYTT